MQFSTLVFHHYKVNESQHNIKMKLKALRVLSTDFIFFFCFCANKSATGKPLFIQSVSIKLYRISYMLRWSVLLPCQKLVRFRDPEYYLVGVNDRLRVTWSQLFLSLSQCIRTLAQVTKDAWNNHTLRIGPAKKSSAMGAVDLFFSCYSLIK